MGAVQTNQTTSVGLGDFDRGHGAGAGAAIDGLGHVDDVARLAAPAVVGLDVHRIDGRRLDEEVRHDLAALADKTEMKQ